MILNLKSGICKWNSDNQNHYTYMEILQISISTRGSLELITEMIELLELIIEILN